MPATSEPAIHRAHVRDMDPETLYRLLQLRVDVFVVEQECPYPELDGRDLEADALMLWIERDGRVVATVRLLHDADAHRIGRVVTAADARQAGLAAVLMREAIALSGDAAIRLDAQAHLATWYSRFGFTIDGPEFLEDGIPHVPMLRP